MRKVWLYFIFVSLLISLVDWHAIAQQGIVIDGKNDDWQGISPIIADPKDDVISSRGNSSTDFKAIYAISDDEFLYIMFETYGRPNPMVGYLASFDLNNDGNAEYSMGCSDRFQTWAHPDLINNPDKEINLLNAKYAIDDVVEFKMPLSTLGNPETIGFRAWINIWDPLEYGDIACCGQIETIFKVRRQEANSAFNDAKVAFDAKGFQKARDLFIQAKNKYAQLEDTEKVTQCDDYIRQSEENMKKTGIELLVAVFGILLSVGYLKRRPR